MRDLPVGKSEPGEPITETAVPRAVRGDGLTVKPKALGVAHIMHGAWGVEAPNGFLAVVFVTHEWTGELESREPGKHAQVRWVEAVALPGNFVGTTSSALQRYLAGGPEIFLNGWGPCAERPFPVSGGSGGTGAVSLAGAPESSSPPGPGRGSGVVVAQEQGRSRVVA